MTLLEQLYTICQKYEPKGWGSLLLTVAGLDISQSSKEALAVELARDLTESSGINREFPGFQDFNLKGSRGIEPGKPSQSLLYHAFASPGVVSSSLADYPSMAELEVIENYIFAAAKRSLASFSSLANGRPLGICVFAYDYRTGFNSVLEKSAQLCFSRTGVARVGNAAYAYAPSQRGFVPWKSGDDDDTIRVVPVRYGTFLSILMKGDDKELGAFGPMGKNFLRDHPLADYTPFEGQPDEIPDDNELDYWVPVHKLFSGTECLTDFSESSGLTVTLQAYHLNQKLARIQSSLSCKLYSTDSLWSPVPDDFESPPFKITGGLANLSAADPDLGSQFLIPVDQPITTQAQISGSGGASGLTFAVEPYKDYLDHGFEYLASSFRIETERNGAHRGPEYVNIRQQVTPKPENLNDESGVPIAQKLKAGNFTAKAYLDASADGWIKASVPELATEISRANNVAAYSLIAPPRFIPYVNQREIIMWTEERMSRNHGTYEDWPRMWAVIPWALSEDRIAPNVELPGSGFKQSDLTATCIVSLPEDELLAPATIVDFGVKRMDFLTDAAAGTFAPGWDTSYDTDSAGSPFLSAYGLGSPFPEDAMICSALGSFWPTAAPDTTRLFPATGWRTVAPLTDKEIGLDGGLSWDGTPAPQLVKSTTGGSDSVVYQSFNYNDYVQNVINGKISIKLLQEIDSTEYKNRVLAMYHSYIAILALDPSYQQALITRGTKPPFTIWQEYASEWITLSFKNVPAIPSAALLEADVSASNVTTPIYEIVMYQSDADPEFGTPTFNQATVVISQQLQIYAYPAGLILKGSLTHDVWVKGTLPS